MVKVRAPELNGATGWVNSEVKLKELKGKKVVLVDFFELTCVNCIRTFPYLKEWWNRYKDKGLLIVGIHTPEFERSKDMDFVKRELKRFGINWPVAVDNEYKIWDAYANMYWPRKYLIDKDGYIVYDHIGEGAYTETEVQIQRFLRDLNPSVELPEPIKPLRPEDDLNRVCYPRTPEIYCGYFRGRFAGKILPDIRTAYNHPIVQGDGIISLIGEFIVESERLIFIDGKLVLNFKGNELNAVMFGDEFVEVRINGRLIPENMRGSDIRVLDGKTGLLPKDYRMYNIIKTEEWGIYTLEIFGRGTEIYAFTFGSCAV